MNGDKIDLLYTNIKTENDSLRNSLHQTQQSLSSTEGSSSVKGVNKPSKTYNKRRVRRRASTPIQIPSPQGSPYTIPTSSEEGFLYKREEMYTLDDSMATTLLYSSSSVSFSLEMQQNYYSQLRPSPPTLTMSSPQEGRFGSLPRTDLMRKGPLMSRERLFAEEDSMERAYIERDRLRYEEANGLPSEKREFLGKRPDTPMTTLLMRITEL